jgi:non-homologous end joining protein Ku
MSITNFRCQIKKLSIPAIQINNKIFETIYYYIKLNNGKYMCCDFSDSYVEIIDTCIDKIDEKTLQIKTINILEDNIEILTNTGHMISINKNCFLYEDSVKKYVEIIKEEFDELKKNSEKWN